MPSKTLSLILGILLLTSLSPPVMAQPDLAHVIVGKSVAKIISPGARRNIRIDIETTIENYYDNGNLKSSKSESKTTDGRLEVRGMKIEELYRAFETRYDFYIDPAESADILNNITCAIVKFRPKPNLSIKKTTDQFINRSEGSIYINLDNFDIVRIAGSIKNPFSFTFSWFFIPIAQVNIYQLEFLAEYTTFDSVLVEQTLNGLADYRVNNNRSIEKFTNKITNHRIK